MEEAISDCRNGCHIHDPGQEKCKNPDHHAWDQAVALYTGSLEREDGSGDGVLLYGLADEMCSNFRTCGREHEEAEGTSSVNIRIFRMFKLGQERLLGELCDEVQNYKVFVVQMMKVPLVQATLLSAYNRGHNHPADIEEAENEIAQGAAFAATVLPFVHACSPDDAQIIYDQMVPTGKPPDYRTVKHAFERNYECMGITCLEVGGIWKDGKYVKHTEPCKDKRKSSLPKHHKTSILALLLVFAMLYGMYYAAKKGFAEQKSEQEMQDLVMEKEIAAVRRELT